VVCFNENKVIGPFFFFEEPTVIGDTFMAIMDNTNLYHVFVRRAFKLDGAPPHFSRCVCVFMDREFLVIGQEEGNPFPGPHILQI